MSVAADSNTRGLFARLASAVERIGADPNDEQEVRLQKRMVVAGSLMGVVAGTVWGLTYLAFDEPFAASLPFSYAAVSVASVVGFGLTRRYHLVRFSQFLLILLLPFFLMMALGGFVAGSAVILWSLLSPLAALLAAGRGQAVAWFVAFAGLVVVSGAVEPLVRSDNNLPPSMVDAFFAMNVAGVSIVAFVLVTYFVGQKNEALALLGQEQQRSERLLLNVLPKEIAALLKDDQRTIADQFDAVSVLFADVVGFTPLSARLAPKEMVELLNEVFSYFDSLTERYRLEKIRTIGDNYMVASGVPRPRPDHAHALAGMALEMNEFIQRRPSIGDGQLRFRMDMNSGPAVAGVIGRQKFHYDLWGDSVNTASRMESHGVPDKIQITRATYELVNDGFVCEPRGLIEVKGKGEMETWFLQARRA